MSDIHGIKFYNLPQLQEPSVDSAVETLDDGILGNAEKSHLPTAVSLLCSCSCVS